ncbi:hypothetical protein BJ322DRAFT_1025795 [Thelephora terrestris]|uniref:Uncharacterized protein n=1 Tax=Thelephora terrestris TaxID=56493 RepID=A0A9P6L120_9AGAM|nr:hypothetical protein BJ322DRAFT_1025795 [Thelephora terrestris]
MTSSCLISRIFELSTGMRCFPPYYATYSSSLKFIDKDKEVDCGISMQTYTPPSHDLYADKTFVWAAFNAALPASGEWIFDAISCIPLEIQQMPPKTSHIAVITGVIHSATEHGGIRSFFALSASEFDYDATSKQWENVPIRPSGLPVTAVGTFKSFSDQGCVLKLLKLSLPAAATVAISPMRSTGHQRDRTPEAAASSPMRSGGSRRAANEPKPSPPLSGSPLTVVDDRDDSRMAATNRTPKKRRMNQH